MIYKIGIGIANSVFFGWALITFWKRALRMVRLGDAMFGAKAKAYGWSGEPRE